MTFYAVANGRTIGIFLNWNDCNNSVKKYKNALYKKFNTKE
jgi:ribonuclease HI